MAALAPAVYFPAGAKPQILCLQRDKAAQAAGLQTVLTDKLRIEQTLIQIRLFWQGFPLLHAADVAAAVAERDGQKLHRKAANIPVGEKHGFLCTEKSIAPGAEPLVHMLVPTEHIPGAAAAGDKKLDRVDDLRGDAAQLELGQHPSALVVHEQCARRDHQRRARGIEILRQGKEPGIPFRHRLCPLCLIHWVT